MISAGSRSDGLLVVEREPLALVITDLRLPDGDGLDLVRATRRLPTPMPSIVVTGFASEASRTAALAAGASAYLAKPFAAASFISLVEKTLDSATSLDRTPSPSGLTDGAQPLQLRRRRPGRETASHLTC
jgi:DNA-binding response OmpR family regulator